MARTRGSRIVDELMARSEWPTPSEMIVLERRLLGFTISLSWFFRGKPMSATSSRTWQTSGLSTIGRSKQGIRKERVES